MACCLLLRCKQKATDVVLLLMVSYMANPTASKALVVQPLYRHWTLYRYVCHAINLLNVFQRAYKIYLRHIVLGGTNPHHIHQMTDFITEPKEKKY